MWSLLATHRPTYNFSNHTRPIWVQLNSELELGMFENYASIMHIINKFHYAEEWSGQVLDVLVNII